MDSPRPAWTPPLEPERPAHRLVVAEEVSTMTRAVAATIRKHVSTAPANSRRRRRLLNKESAIRRSLCGAKGLR